MVVGILAEVEFHMEKGEDIHRKESHHKVIEDIHTEKEEVDSRHMEMANMVELPFPCHPSPFIASYHSFYLLCVGL